MTRTQWDDAFPVSAAATAVVPSGQNAAPVSPPPSTAERGVPIAYVGGPLHGYVADHLGARVQPYDAPGRYHFDDEALVMRWKADAE